MWLEPQHALIALLIASALLAGLVAFAFGKTRTSIDSGRGASALRWIFPASTIAALLSAFLDPRLTFLFLFCCPGLSALIAPPFKSKTWRICGGLLVILGVLISLVMPKPGLQALIQT